jgi:hypothetical protein
VEHLTNTLAYTGIDQSLNKGPNITRKYYTSMEQLKKMNERYSLFSISSAMKKISFMRFPISFIIFVSCHLCVKVVDFFGRE